MAGAKSKQKDSAGKRNSPSDSGSSSPTMPVRIPTSVPDIKLPEIQLSEEQQHLQYWIEEGWKMMEDKVGEENLVYIKGGSAVLVLLLLIYFFMMMRRILADPLKGRDTRTSSPKQAKKGAVKQQKGKHGDGSPKGEDDSTASAPTKSKDESPSNYDAMYVVERSRPLSIGHATSHIKGFTQCYIAASPLGNYYVISCTKTRKVHIHPAQYLRPHLGKELASKGFFSLDEHLGAKPTVSVIGFSDCGTYLALGESNSDTFHVFNVDDNGKHAHLAWSLKMPNRRVVSCFDRIAVEPLGNAILGFHHKDCEVEVLHRYQGVIGKERFKIGNSIGWTNGSGYLATAGSYMHDVKVGKLSIRHDASSLALDRTFTIKSNAKVSSVVLTTPHAPSCSVASLLITFDEAGEGRIYNLADVRPTIGEEPHLVGEFSDKEYARNPEASGNQLRGIAYTFTGEQYHEVLHLALWNATDIAYYRQVNNGVKELKVNADRTVVEGTGIQMQHVKDLHAVHDDEPIRSVCFVHQATGLMTASADHSHGPRLWAL